MAAVATIARQHDRLVMRAGWADNPRRGKPSVFGPAAPCRAMDSAGTSLGRTSHNVNFSMSTQGQVISCTRTPAQSPGRHGRNHGPPRGSERALPPRLRSHAKPRSISFDTTSRGLIPMPTGADGTLRIASSRTHSSETSSSPVDRASSFLRFAGQPRVTHRSGAANPAVGRTQHAHDLGFGKSALRHRNLLVHPAEKIRLPHPLDHEQDDPARIPRCGWMVPSCLLDSPPSAIRKRLCRQAAVYCSDEMMALPRRMRAANSRAMLASITVTISGSVAVRWSSWSTVSP